MILVLLINMYEYFIMYVCCTKELRVLRVLVKLLTLGSHRQVMKCQVY